MAVDDVDYDFWEDGMGHVSITIEHYAESLKYILKQIQDIHDTRDEGIKQYKIEELEESITKVIILLYEEKASRLGDDED